MTDGEIKTLIAEVHGSIAPEADLATAAGDADLRKATDQHVQELEA